MALHRADWPTPEAAGVTAIGERQTPEALKSRTSFLAQARSVHSGNVKPRHVRRSGHVRTPSVEQLRLAQNQIPFAAAPLMTSA